MQIGALIKKARLARNLKQKALAKMIGISVTGFGDIERGKTNTVTIKRIEQISIILEIPITLMLEEYFAKNENEIYSDKSKVRSYAKKTLGGGWQILSHFFYFANRITTAVGRLTNSIRFILRFAKSPMMQIASEASQ